MPVGIYRLRAKLDLPAIDRVGPAGAGHGDVEERAENRDHAEWAMLAEGKVRGAPRPACAVGSVSAAKVGERTG